MAFIENGNQNPMPIVLNNAGSNFVDNLSKKFLMKTKTISGIFGFVFDYESRADAGIQAEITDHFAEDNSVLNDHIAIKPFQITLSGFVGELVQDSFSNGSILDNLNNLQEKLTIVPAYLGKYTPGGLATIQKAITKTTDVVNKVKQTVARVQNVAKLFSNSSAAKTKQELAFAQLRAIMESKQPFPLETPFGVFSNMVIMAISLVQPEETKSWSDVSVTLKQMRFVQEATAQPDKNANKRTIQDSALTDKGQTQGTGNKTLFASLVDSFKK